MPFELLPLELNCPVLVEDKVLDAVKTCDPAIIHYHGRFDDAGLVIANYNPNARMRIEAFNARARLERPINLVASRTVW